MGAWGPAIFSDDTACDIRGDYQELLEDGVADLEATRQVIQLYRHLHEDEAHILWLALAAAQSALGRLEDDVKQRALAVIDHDVGLELWEQAGPKDLAKRKAALAKLRMTVVGPQTPAKRVRRPWAHVTDLTPGDVLSITLSDGTLSLFRVARLDEHRVGTAPILRQLKWSKTSAPSLRKLQKLKALPDTRPMSDKPSVTFRVARHRKKDEDWQDVGFSLIGRVRADPDDADFQPRTCTAWRALRTNLERR